MSVALILAGKIAGLIGFVLILIAAYRESLLWFIGSLFIPLITLAFVILHWQEGKRGFFWTLGGTLLWFVGAAAARSGA